MHHMHGACAGIVGRGRTPTPTDLMSISRVVLFSIGAIVVGPCCAAAILPARPVSRRALLGGLAGAACSAAARPASATLVSEIRDAEAALSAANGRDEITDALTRMLDVVQEYEGLSNAKLREEIVAAMRAKRTRLQGSPEWNGIPEEAYNRLMRQVDPWRVTELQPRFQGAIFGFVPVYVGLLAVRAPHPSRPNQRPHAPSGSRPQPHEPKYSRPPAPSQRAGPAACARGLPLRLRWRRGALVGPAVRADHRRVKRRGEPAGGDPCVRVRRGGTSPPHTCREDGERGAGARPLCVHAPFAGRACGGTWDGAVGERCAARAAADDSTGRTAPARHAAGRGPRRASEHCAPDDSTRCECHSLGADLRAALASDNNNNNNIVVVVVVVVVVLASAPSLVASC